MNQIFTKAELTQIYCITYPDRNVCPHYSTLMKHRVMALPKLSYQCSQTSPPPQAVVVLTVGYLPTTLRCRLAMAVPQSLFSLSTTAPLSSLTQLLSVSVL